MILGHINVGNNIVLGTTVTSTIVDLGTKIMKHYSAKPSAH